MLRLSDKIKRFIVFYAAIFPAFVAGQDLPVFNQYFTDYTLLNQALIGLHNCYSINISDQHQWFGISGAPNTQILYANGRFGWDNRNEKKYHGLGAILMRDQNGPYAQLGFSGIYSYHLLISESRKAYISFALTGILSQSSLDQTGFNNYTNDPAVTGERLRTWNPDATVAMAIYNPDFFAGITIANILPQISTLSEPVPADINPRHYFFIAGYRLYNYNRDITFEPALVLKLTENIQNQVDINLKVIFENIFWTGLSYRHNLDNFPGSMITLIPAAGITIRNFSINYAFGMGFNNLQSHSLGSHYFQLTWKLCKESRGEVPCPVFK